MADLRDDVPFRGHFRRLYDLGPRPIYEMLLRLAQTLSATLAIQTKVTEYVAVDPEVLRALGAHVLPPAPLSLVSDSDKISATNNANAPHKDETEGDQ